MSIRKMEESLWYKIFILIIVLSSLSIKISSVKAENEEIIISPTIEIFTGAGNQGTDLTGAGSDVAFDSINNRFLVVWNDEVGQYTNLYAQLINSDGSPYGTRITISLRDHSTNPQVDFDSKNGRFLIVWRDYFIDTFEFIDVFGHFVNADGSLYGNIFAISPTDHQHFWGLPKVKFDSIKNRFLVIWQDGNAYPPYNVYGQLVSDTGVLQGGMIQFTNFGMDYHLSYPDIEFDSVNGRFLITWANQYDGYVYGRLLNTDGSNYGSEITIGYYGLGSVYLSTLSCDSVNGRFLQFWTGNKGQIINANGTLYGSEIELFNPSNYLVDTTSVIFDSGNNRFLAMGIIQSPYQGIVGQFLNTDGTIDGKDFPILEKAIYSLRLPADSGSAQTGSLVTWSGFSEEPLNGYDIFGRFVKDARTQCFCDFEPDKDVDGSDLVNLINSGGINIEVFAENFGRTGCL
jgi:hypothetical protein